MLGVLLVDLGLALGFAALVSLVRPLRFLGIRSRRMALVCGVVALLVVLAGMLLPAPLRRARKPPATRLDAIIPAWQFGEHHETRVHASPEQVEAAIRDVTANEIRLFRTLTWIRNPHLPGTRQPRSVLNAAGDRPILESAQAGGFLMLAEEPRRELVLGTLVMVPDSLRKLPLAERQRLRAEFTPAKFVALDKPGYAKAAMNFVITDEGDGWVHLATDTRVFATNDDARRRFAAYWRVIYPGSSMLRRTWLAAIRKRAEAMPPAAH
jgi:hypothetical protein